MLTDQLSPEVLEEVQKIEVGAVSTPLQRDGLVILIRKEGILQDGIADPSQDVIKKFLRDVEKWNFEAEVANSSASFPSPTYEIIDETYFIKYKIYINDTFSIIK